MELDCRLAVRDDFERLWALIEESLVGWKTNLTRSSLWQDLFGSRKLDLAALADETQAPYIELDINQAETPVPFCQAIIAASQSSELVGYILFHQAYSPWKGRLAFINYIYVKPELRLQGIANGLLHEFRYTCKLDDINYILFDMSIVKPEFKEVLARHNMHVFRDDKTDWSVYRIEYKAISD